MSVSASTIIDRLREGAAPVAQVAAPAAPGVYAWFVDDPVALPTLPNQGADPIYIGMSSNLAVREFDTHFKSGQTGFSTLRRSLGALLKTELALIARPRGTGASKTNYTCYRFDERGEDLLTRWMHEHLRVAVQPCGEPQVVESELIVLAQPPLNLTGRPNPSAVEIRALRKVCADEARLEHPR